MFRRRGRELPPAQEECDAELDASLRGARRRQPGRLRERANSRRPIANYR